MEKDIGKLKDENNELFFMIQDLKFSNEKKYIELKSKEKSMNSELINEFESDDETKIKWVYSLKKDDYDKYIIGKFNPNYIYVDEIKHLSLLTKLYYDELNKLIKINNEFVQLLGTGKVLKTK